MRIDIGWPHCWCETVDKLTPFDTEYLRCRACETLVCRAEPDASTSGVQEDATDFYGEQYWNRHQAETFGFPTISERARADLPERCVFWLRALLAACKPPGRLLEVGASHGAFLKLASLAGFDAIGIEMSPSIVEYAHEVFGVAMMRGPLDAVSLPERSFNVVCSFDVLEHFPDPLSMLSRIARLLVADGIALIQTPAYPIATENHLRGRNDRFLEHLRSPEHVYLFSTRSLEELAHRAGFSHVRFLPPIFDYDQFALLSSQPVELREDEAVASDLLATPSGRIVLALIDANREATEMRRVASERQTVIDGLKAVCDERLALIERLDAELRKSQAASPGPD